MANSVYYYNHKAQAMEKVVYLSQTLIDLRSASVDTEVIILNTLVYNKETENT